jgi:ribosomal protein RSM22 (predicted rRNA methylase)
MASRGRLSEAVIRAIDEAAGLPEAVPESLCHAVSALSERFTRARGALADAYLEDPFLRAAYLAYYLPVNLAKVQALLDEMPAPVPSSLRVLDVGSGPGTVALAVLDWLRRRADRRDQCLEVVSLDRSASALREAERLWRTYAGSHAAGPARLVTMQVDAARSELKRRLADGGPYHLIVVANMLNELFQTDRDPIKRRAALLTMLLDRLDPNGTLMVIEPALRETSRALHQVRDRLVAGGTCTVYSPCLHDRPCPALIKEDDWCHEERGWEPPPAVAAIDRKVGFIKDALKFSYLLVRKDGATIVPRTPDVSRVVSELRKMKGEQRAWLCDGTGRSEVGRLDRERSAANAAMDDWHRGAIVRISDIVRPSRGGLVRIPASTSTEIIRPV